MVEHSVNQLPPQSPDDYPYLSNAARAPAGGAHCSKTFSPSDSGLVQPGPSVSGLSAGMNHPGAGHPLAGYPWGAPEPFPYSQASYPQVMMLPPPGAFWGSPELAMRRKRTTNRRVAIAGGVLGLVTSVARLAYLVIVLLNGTYFELEVGLAVVIAFVGPLGIGAGWSISFIPALIACLQARSRNPQTQPDGWPEAKGVTAVLLASSIALGVPVASLVVAVYLSGGSGLGSDFWKFMFGGSMVGAGIVAVAYVILLIKICTLDVTARTGVVASAGGAY